MTHKHIGAFPDMSQVPVKLTSTIPTNTISPGDLVAQVSGYALKASDWTWDTNLATTQAAFALAFIGLSAGRSRAASTDARDLNIPVLKDGDELCDVTSGNYTFGQYLGPAKDTGNNLKNTLVGVATKSLATHMSLETVTGVTSLKCRIITLIKR